MLPSDLDRAIRRARAVEAAAQSRRQRLAAVAATGRLLAAAASEGWSSRDLAEAADLGWKATQRRITIARRVQQPAGLDVTPAPPRHKAPPLPPALREWLTAGEASTEFGVSESVIGQWWRAGLLPRTRPRDRGHLWYSRTDLQQILAAPRHPNGGVSWQAARAASPRRTCSDKYGGPPNSGD